MYWVAVLRQANSGDKEAQELLRQTDEARAENGMPSVREELEELTMDREDRNILETMRHGKVIWRKPGT